MRPANRGADFPRLYLGRRRITKPRTRSTSALLARLQRTDIDAGETIAILRELRRRGERR